MTRADKSRLFYVLALLLMGGICLSVGWYFSYQPSALIVIGLLLVIPGRIPMLLWREFYAGQRALQIGDHERARASFIAFIEKVRAQPWLKRLMYLKWGVHTWDIEAMALNNLGNTYVEKGEPHQAVGWYEAALAVDPDYGVPYANLAVIGYARGAEAEAKRLLDRAHALGNRDLTHAAASERGTILRSMTKPD
ncbi:MAG TPA: tetratricopeptide repeat protein [Blastocatellia bacterium]|nr:tetratricopeptide repeat protein [Blastocatellia bacterium]